MQIQLTENGPRFSRIVAGVWKWGVWGWKLNDQDTLTLVEKCLEQGVSTFDHADIYGHYTAEADFGKIFRLNPSLRDKMQLVTKCGIKLVTPNRPAHKIKSYDTSKAYILQCVDNSLRDLQTDYLDLLLIHRPSPLMDPDEIAAAFDQLKQAGKVQHFGVSNFTPSQFQLLASRTELVTNQIEASIIHLDPFLNGTLDQSLEKRVAPMAWSPLGSGKVFAKEPDEQVQRIRKVGNQLQEKYNASLDQILLAFLLKHPARILPVLGTARAERVAAATQALNIELTREEWFELWEASTGKEVP